MELLNGPALFYAPAWCRSDHAGANLSRDSRKNRYPESKAIARAARVTLSGMQFTGGLSFEEKKSRSFKAAAPAI
jgi:hypothetical protein